MRDDDRQLSIKALKELIATEEDAGPADQKEYDLQRITLATLEAREREHAAHIARWSAQIARLESGEAVESLDIELGPYRLIRMLGQGGNGLVWLAEHPMPDGPPRLVAIKVLQERWRQHPERVDRFRREIGVMGRIQHRSIVPIYDYDVRRFFVVMPYLAGGTLRDRLQGKPVPEAQALSWLGQIGAALDFVHDRHHELLHRDVKPENMLFADDGETLYLSDFGLVFSAQADEPITQDAGRPIGTGRYMAPEQWRKQPLSRATDLYAVGIVAYELLTGQSFDEWFAPR